LKRLSENLEMSSMVECKKLGDVCCRIIDGSHNPPKGVAASSNYLLSSQNVHDGYLDFTNVRYLSDEDFYKENQRTQVEAGDVLLTIVGTIGRACVLKGDEGNIAFQRSVAILKPTKLIQSQYLMYSLQCLTRKLNAESKGGAQKGIYLKQLSNIQISVPSIPEQTRIVGILDTFTASIENLKKQIVERRKQYEYYLNQLLGFEGKDDNEIKCWGEICDIIKGSGVQKVDFIENGRGCIHYGQIYTHYGSFTYATNRFVSEEVFKKARKASKGDIIMTDTSENVEDICKSVAYLGDDDIAVSNHALIIKHKQNAKFLSYSTQTNSFFRQKRKFVVGVKVSGIKPEHLDQIKIFLPSLKEQSRIVAILDTFETSIANLKAQLKQREKQYEYYRNKLLTFD